MSQLKTDPISTPFSGPEINIMETKIFSKVQIMEVIKDVRVLLTHILVITSLKCKSIERCSQNKQTNISMHI